MNVQSAGTVRRVSTLCGSVLSGLTVVASLSDGPERTYEWDLSERPGDGWLTVGIRDDALTFTYAVA